MSSRARTVDLDWPISALALLAALISGFLLARPVALRPVGWTAPTPEAGTLSFHVGEIRRRPAGSLVWYSAERGDKVFVGDALFVAARSVATVQLEGGAQLELDQNTLVVVEPPGGGARAPRRIAVERGTVLGTSGAQGLQMESRGAVAALAPNAEAQLDVGEERTEVAVRRGNVSLDGAGRKNALGPQEVGTVDAQGGYARGERPPVALGAPRPNHRQLAGTPVEFQWEPVADAAALQVANDRSFRSPVTHPASGGFSAQPLAAGVYWWRVVDAKGKAVSEARPLTVLRDVPPRLLTPSNGERFDSASLGLRWTEVPGATGYEVEVSRDASFSQPAFRAAGAATQLRWEDAEDGTYHWRARAQVAGGLGQWSAPLSFRVVLAPLPAAPVLRPAEIEVDSRDAGAN